MIRSSPVGMIASNLPIAEEADEFQVQSEGDSG
jgi:hypothetical protein